MKEREAARRLDVLIPTVGRSAALAVLLAGLVGQDFRGFRVLVADQGRDAPVEDAGEVRAVACVLAAHGTPVRFFRNLPRRGMAQQRQFLLDRSSAPYVLFLDDDLILEPFVLGELMSVIEREHIGFVGSGLIGLSYAGDHRPREQAVELWKGPVRPERVIPGDPSWARHRLHNAANLLHVQRRLGADPARPLRYKVAWVGGCVLYDADKLRRAGGFEFWRRLPARHSGEDVLAQLHVMARFGGCGVLPSGVYHQELPTSVPDRRVDAPWALHPGLALEELPEAELPEAELAEEEPVRGGTG